MLNFTEDDVRRLLPMGEAIRIMRSAFAAYAKGEAQNQPRRRLRLPTGATLHSLAGAYGRYFGTKVYSSHPRYGAFFTVLLYDAENAHPLAQFEANHLGQIRTGAASGLAADLLAHLNARHVGIIGAGFQARTQLEAVLAVRKVEFVKVWSRKEQNRKHFAESASSSFGIPVEPVETANEALEGTDILITATYAKTPVFDPAAVDKPLHINAMGSNQPDRAELPAQTIHAADLVVVDDIEQAQLEAGDLLLALDPAGWTRVLTLGQITADAELTPATAPADPHSNKLTIFKSVGLGLQDVAVAAYIYEKAAL